MSVVPLAELITYEPQAAPTKPRSLRRALWALMRGLPDTFQTISVRGFTWRQRGLLIWIVIAAWLLFGGSGYIELALAIISVLVFIAMAELASTCVSKRHARRQASI
jgi:hypothetical protein